MSNQQKKELIDDEINNLKQYYLDLLQLGKNPDNDPDYYKVNEELREKAYELAINEFNKIKVQNNSGNEKGENVDENLQKEMLEGENAVAAVENLKRAELLAESQKLEDKKPVVLESGCPQLYDPCTKAPLPDLQTLEKRVRELKKLEDTTPVGLYGITSKTSNFEFLTRIFIDPSISLDDMVSFRLLKDRQPGSDVYEVLSRLFVYFGGIDGVSLRDDGNYAFMKKIEGVSPIYPNATEALKKMECLASRKMGISDITLRRIKIEGKTIDGSAPYCESECDALPTTEVNTYLMSVKWYKDEKNAEHYDLEKLFTAGEYIVSAEQKPVDIIVFLKSKRDFEIAHNRAFRQYVKEIGNTFFGWHEDVKPFLQEIRKSIFELAEIKNITPLQALAAQYFTVRSKPILSLQLHQDIIVTSLCESLKTTEDFLYLIGVLPRGGKTYIAGGIMRQYLKQTNLENLNVFWITAAPNATRTQVENDLIDKFQDFDDFEFVEAKDQLILEKKKKHSIIFLSSQLLIGARGSKKRDFLLDLVEGKQKVGLIFFDEAHKTGAGDTTKAEIDNIILTYRSTNLPLIFLTATYYKIIFEYEIKKQNRFVWDYTDVLATRALGTESEQENAISNLKNRFGSDLVTRVIEERIKRGESLETMAKAYVGFPDLYFLSAHFQQETIDRFEEQNLYNPNSGFNLRTIFALRPGVSVRDVKHGSKIREDAHNIFLNKVNPRNLVSLITPKLTFEEVGPGGAPLRKEEGPSLEPSILGRIEKMSSDTQSRFRLDENPTLLMFLPVGGAGADIFLLLVAWASLLMNHQWWRSRYEIACVVKDEMLSAKNISSQIGQKYNVSDVIHIISKDYKTELNALEKRLHCRKENQKGLVILTGEALSMGISLPCTDVVFLFNDDKSPDSIIQKMYRALTPSVDKKSAFVVDLNPVRTLAALYGYTREAHQESNTKSEILDIIYDTYSWDADVYDFSLRKGDKSKPISFQQRIQDLFEQAEADTDGEYRIKENDVNIALKTAIESRITGRTITEIHSVFSGEKLKSSLQKLGLRNVSEVSLKSGKIVVKVRIPKPAMTGDKEPTYEEQEYSVENFKEAVIDFVKYLALTSSKPTFDQALEEFQSDQKNIGNSSLKHNVVRYLKSSRVIKGNDDDILVKLMLMAVKDFAHSSSERVFREMKGKVEEKSTRKNEILKIIHKRLTPKTTQKKSFGEVFTPIELVELLIKNLPRSVWKNPELKWLDPANGIGNFPITVFYKLDEGLKEWEPNEKKRRKHIINNMLYMIEIQSNNSRIARNIFKKLCDDCDPNILTTDSLTITKDKLAKKGWPTEYDIVMGNPPFQKGKNSNFFVEFIDLANKLMKQKGYLLFVIPNRVLIPDHRANTVILVNFNPTIIYHTVNPKFFPNIATTICALVAKKEDYEHDTKVIFSNGEKTIDLFFPTPTQEDDIYVKNVSDKILLDTDHLEFEKTKPSGSWIYVQRQWVRYSPDKPEGGGSHVFQIISPPSKIDGKFINVPDNLDKDILSWFLNRSEVMRFITKIYASSMNVPPFLWSLLPKINLKSKSDDEVYKLLSLTEKDKKIIKDILKDSKETVMESEGGSYEQPRKRFAKTRKIYRS